MKFEIWLGNDNTHFDHGTAIFDDGHTEPLGTFRKVVIQQDRLWVGTTDEYGELDELLRWYPKPGVIEFYAWSMELEVIVLHNDSDHDIYVCGRAYLKPGESVEIHNDIGRKHSQFLRGYTPVGLGRLVETSHTDEEYQETVGKYGLILSRPSRRNPSKTVLRFVLAGALSGEELDLEGIESSAGDLTYEEGSRIVMQTESSRYVFAYDKGDTRE